MEHRAAIKQELEIDDHDMCRWDPLTQTLKGSQVAKAKKFCKLKLVKYVGDGLFACLPIPGYNSTTYAMVKERGEWVCSCQWFVKQGLVCSPLRALFLYFKQRTGEDVE